MNYLQKWWEEKYPNAGVEKIVNASEGIISIEDIIDFEQWIVKKLTLTDVRCSNWIKFEETKFVEDGIYPIETSEGRIISAERFKGSWMEYDTPIKDNESVVGYYT
jgi:hypothetical protein